MEDQQSTSLRTIYGRVVLDDRLLTCIFPEVQSLFAVEHELEAYQRLMHRYAAEFEHLSMSVLKLLPTVTRQFWVEDELALRIVTPLLFLAPFVRVAPYFCDVMGPQSPFGIRQHSAHFI